MFWSWIVIAVAASLLALLSGRTGPFVIGLGATLAATLDHFGADPIWQWLALAAGIIVTFIRIWRGARA